MSELFFSATSTPSPLNHYLARSGPLGDCDEKIALSTEGFLDDVNLKI